MRKTIPILEQLLRQRLLELAVLKLLRYRGFPFALSVRALRAVRGEGFPIVVTV